MGGKDVIPDLGFMPLTGLRNILEQARIVPELTELLGPADEFYLVGGALRDFFLRRPLNDFDFAAPFDPTLLAKRFAGRIGGYWFFLDEPRRQSRIVAGPLTYDFAPFRAADLVGDLRRRDFTVNALAIPLSPGGVSGSLFDPLGGRGDLEDRVLRACSAGVLADDPLRVLKGVRHAAVLGFAPEAETFALMRAAVTLLGRAAAERVRAELAAIFAAPAVARPLALMEDLDLWRGILGSPAGSLAVAKALAGRMEAVLAACSADPEAMPLLAQEFEEGLGRAALLKLAAFLRGYRPADLPACLAALRFGRKAAAILAGLQALSPAKMEAAARLVDYERGRALWAAQLGRNPIDFLLFLPCLTETPEAALRQVLPILHAWRRQAVMGRIPDLVDGGWLRRNLGIGEGKEAGALLAALRREEIAGRVRTIAQAADFLRARRQETDQQND